MELLRYAAFTTDPAGGNPAGVVPDATGLTDIEMQQIAADLGYSETAFLFPTGPGTADVRYFAPLTEVPFCGHATIASAVALAHAAERQLGSPADPTPSVLHWNTSVGIIEVVTARTDQGVSATLTNRPPVVTEVTDEIRAELLAALRLEPADLDDALPIRVSNTGNAHPVVPVTARGLENLDYDEDRLRSLMHDQGWTTTVQITYRRSADEFEVRNPFPPGGVREDPATGSAATALGGYLRELGLVDPPARVIVHQGRFVGRPGLLTVDIPAQGGISVSGYAVPIPA